MTREQLLEHNDAHPVKEPVPEWGGDVHLRTMSLEERLSIGDEKDSTPFLIQVLLRALSDEQGQRLMKDEDAAALAKKNAIVLRRLFDKALTINGMGKGATASAEKNSEPTPTSTSPIA